MGSHVKIAALIPARMGSTRFPGKPLASLLGKPMIGHVSERVARNPLLAITAVATCDSEIADYIESTGGRVVMTGSHHERASDRCAEALAILEKVEGTRYDIVVMVQGDEPMTHPQMITEALQPMLSDPKVQVVNLLGQIESVTEFEDRNCIKVVCDMQGNALYFSREPIPTRSKVAAISMGKQVCVIPFRRDFLLTYTSMKPTPLEIVESIDMLRILEHGMQVRMVPTRYQSRAVDTPADLELVGHLMAKLPPDA
jgi:3-deoxy-manno-octulosonate cytidylyltransferase (CMP-KDO synthetase)